PRNLLRQRARALCAPALDEIREHSGGDAEDVDAEVPIELRVFGGDDRLVEHRVDVVVADDDAPLGGEFADDLAVRGVHTGDGARRVIIERGDLRQVAGVREQHAGADPEHRRHDEQRGDAGVTRDTDYYVFHRHG